ncbi:hypothetical protein CWS01_10790, partial [Niallia nealsonii]
WLKQVDWSERCETPVGLAGQVRSRRAQPEDAHHPPHGKRASLHCNHPTPLKITKFTKTAFSKKRGVYR